MADTGFVQITPEQVSDLTLEFLAHLRPSYAAGPHKFVIVVGGIPGAGKTTAAKKMAYVSRSVHVQSNSARQLLREHGLSWGKNVNILTQAVVEELLSKGCSVVLDGMVTKKEERELIKSVATKHRAKVFFNAVLCDPKIASLRARDRYLTNTPSTFEDWRCDPSKVEGYVESIFSRELILQKALDEVPDNPNDRIRTLDNNGSETELMHQVHMLWSDIKKKL